jgi:nicotinate-nucleotide adenylyltransferase
MRNVTLCFALFFLSLNAYSEVLSEERLKSCKKIAIIAGTYDPFTHGHKTMGVELMKKLPFDCIIYLPTQDPPHKIASPFQSRYEMLEAALKNDPNLLYPSPDDLKLGTKDYVKKLKTHGHTKEVFAVMGSDLSPQNRMYYINELRIGPDGYIFTGRGDDSVEIAKAFEKKPYHVVPINESTSSTDARKWFVANDDVYFAKDVPLERFPTDILDPEVSKYIQQNGLYLGSNGVTTRGPLRIAKTAFTTTLDDVGLYHPLRKIVVNKHKQDTLTEIIVDGKKYPLRKHLGSGLTADAYIFNYDGRDHVVKIANATSKLGSHHSRCKNRKLA